MAQPINNKLPFENFKIHSPKIKKLRGSLSSSKRSLFNLLYTNIKKHRVSCKIQPGIKNYFGAQKSIVKASYLSNKYPGQWGVHGRYLQREGAQKELERGEGFNEQLDDINISKTLNEWQSAGDERLWKIIVSPEFSERIDLKDHTRTLLSALENKMGRKLQWVAIDHYNTDNFHVHLAVRSLDAMGEKISFNSNLVKAGIRNLSERIITEKLGLRTGIDLIEKREKTLRSKHVTEIDRIIEKKLTSDHFINLVFDRSTPFQQEQRRQIIGRLQYLETLNLAQKDSSASWYVEPTFIDYLKFSQEQNDIIKSLSKHKDNLIDQDLPVNVNKVLNLGDKVVGRVIGTGLSERLEDLRYIFVEGVDGVVHYVIANNSILKKRDTGNLSIGDIIYLERSEFIKDEKKISYIKVDTFTDFESIGYSKEVNNIDKYIAEKMVSNGVIFEVSETDNRVRKDFLRIVKSRISFLKSQNVLSEDLKVDTLAINKKLNLKLDRNHR